MEQISNLYTDEYNLYSIFDQFQGDIILVHNHTDPYEDDKDNTKSTTHAHAQRDTGFLSCPEFQLKTQLLDCFQRYVTFVVTNY